MQVEVRVQIPLSAIYKTNPRTSKMDENWWRYGQTGRKHHLAHISVISWSFWLIFGEKTHRVADKGPWLQVRQKNTRVTRDNHYTGYSSTAATTTTMSTAATTPMMAAPAVTKVAMAMTVAATL